MQSYKLSIDIFLFFATYSTVEELVQTDIETYTQVTAGDVTQL